MANITKRPPEELALDLQHVLGVDRASGESRQKAHDALAELVVRAKERDDAEDDIEFEVGQCKTKINELLQMLQRVQVCEFCENCPDCEGQTHDRDNPRHYGDCELNQLLQKFEH